MRSDALARARTFLFVPGNRPERFAKALSSGADAVVIDWEDSVPPSDKDAAREAFARALPGLTGSATPFALRINSAATPAGRDDLQWLSSAPSLPCIMPPKVESDAELQAVLSVQPNTSLLPLIESATGYLQLDRIAASPSVIRLALGHIDFMADTGLNCSDDERELTPLRFAMAMHSRSRRLAPPVDGVTTAIDDAARLNDDVARALKFGFGGKLCIHPRQVPVIHAAMEPTAEEIAWARRVIAADEASGGNAIQLDGRMIDRPVVERASRTLARV